MSQQMSPHRPRIGVCHPLRIIRFLQEKNQGVKRNQCDHIVLYSKIMGRVMPLRKLEENRQEMQGPSGSEKANERTILLAPNSPMNKVKSGDYILIPWGVRPNTWCPPNTPAGPCIVLNTPTGQQKLVWQDEQYVGDNILLTPNDDGWCLSGEIDFCFDNFNFICQPFPEGYSFGRSTGPAIQMKIIRFDAQEDEHCRISHYSAYVEYRDRDNEFVQQ